MEFEQSWSSDDLGGGASGESIVPSIGADATAGHGKSTVFQFPGVVYRNEPDYVVCLFAEGLEVVGEEFIAETLAARVTITKKKTNIITVV